MSVVIISIVVVEATHCVVSPPPLPSRSILSNHRRLPRGEGNDDGGSSSNYFSLASKHFNATSTNELVLFSLLRNPLRHPPPEQNRASSPGPFPCRSPLLTTRTRSQLGHPLTRSPHYFNCANGNNSPC